jgi:hypothetical protein
LKPLVTNPNYGSNLWHQAVKEGRMVNKKRIQRLCAWLLTAAILGAVTASGQGGAPYQPKFPGDPARSESEAQALGYMRVVLRAEREYKKRHTKYAPSLETLAGTGSFTKRMAHSTDRGDYTVGFRAHKDGFVLTMTPKHMDSEHRSFYAEEDGVIHGDDQKSADLSSPKVK